MYGKGLLQGLWITLKHHFEWDITVQYPEEMPHLAERFRGHLYLEFEKCQACGICVRTCPNRVLSLEQARDEVTKKRKLISYTIDHQYCMFCNLCVESCPKNCLHFDHDFELSQYNRDDIKTVYHRPPEMDKVTDESSQEKSESNAGEDDKTARQVQAMLTALQKNPSRVLARLVDGEEPANILAEILLADKKKAAKMAELMVTDKEKAKKVAMAFINKEIKQKEAEAKGGDGE